MDCILFQIHRSKFKPDPFGNLGQASEISVTHAVFFLGICKYTFNCFFPMLVEFAIFRGMPDILSKINILRPDVLGDELFVFGAVGAMA